MKKIIFTLLLLLSITINAKAQSFNATVNRNTLPEGETFVLTLDLQGVDTASSPDLNSLSKDFTVLSVSNSYHTSIINNNVSKSRRWNLVLIPNNQGEAIIPSIEVEGYKTQPITIKVTPAGQEDKLVQDSQSQADSPKFKLSGKADNLTPYVQEQINYRLKLFDAGGLQGAAPYFAGSDSDWIVKTLGEPKVETKIVNGQSLREITFDYALFPQKSGELTIPPVKFEGYYLTKETRNDPFARFFDDDEFFSGFGLNTVFANKNPVVLNTKPIKVNVRPAPQQATGWWLPAKDVKLSAEFDGSKGYFKQGEPINRTIYLKATGVLDTNLPEIKFANVEGLKQYPEKPINEMTLSGGDIVSVSKISNVYIPEKSGEVTLPAITVNWFNTRKGSFETAVIPELKINVIAAKADNAKPEVAASITPAALKAVANQNPVTDAAANDNTLTIILLLAAFVSGIIITLGLNKLFALLSQKGKHRRSVITAAKDKDVRRLRDELILWGQKHFPNRKVNNLQDVADIFNNPHFNRELEKIRETLYAENEKNWDSAEFLTIFCKLSKQIKAHQRTKDEPLPKLYK